jgi:hypothetical protein
MEKKEIIKDLRTLNAINKKIGNIFVFDKTYKYILSPTYYSIDIDRNLKKMGYSVKYFDGCFKPFITKN